MSERAVQLAKKPGAKKENSELQAQKTCCPQRMSSPADRILLLQKTAGNQAVQRLIRSGALQAKLKISIPGDRYEQEADRVAEQVVSSMPPIQRKCKTAPCPLEDKEKKLIQRKTVQTSDTAGASVADSLIKNLGSGQPLDPATRAYFEPHFGHDFSGVRLHTDTKAAEAARAVSARAFTVGKDVFFDAGLYTPDTLQGRQLLAHELTHIVQQMPQGYAASTPLWLNRAQRYTGLEVAMTTSMASNNRPVYITQRTASITMMRQPENEAESPGVLATIGGGLVGEFNEDPTFAMIGVDMGVSLIPILDQASDIRDISAHVYYMTADNQYKSPGRWVGLVFSLIGLFPEVGSVIKSISKFAIKGVRELLSHLEDLFKLLRRFLPDIKDIGRFQRYITDNWDNIVKFGKSAWKIALEKASHWVDLISRYASKWISRFSRFLREKWRQIKEAWAMIKEIAPKKLDEAFVWVRRQVDNVLEKVRELLGLRKESDFGDISKELGLEKPGTTVPTARRNIFPDFEDVPSSLQSLATDQAQRLGKQLGIPIPQDRILNAPWVGRIRDRAGDITSQGTSQGWLRNESRFWSEFKRRFPADFQIIGPNNTVTSQLAQRYGWPKSTIGDKLVHHHMGNGSFVVAIPESLHQKLSGAIHAAATVVAHP